VIVVDASALSAFVLREEGWRNLAGYLANAVAPDHAVVEVANAVWRAARTSALTEEESRKAFNLLPRMVGRNIVLEPELKYRDEALIIPNLRRYSAQCPLRCTGTQEKPTYTLVKGGREWQARWAYT